MHQTLHFSPLSSKQRKGEWGGDELAICNLFQVPFISWMKLTFLIRVARNENSILAMEALPRRHSPFRTGTKVNLEILQKNLSQLDKSGGHTFFLFQFYITLYFQFTNKLPNTLSHEPVYRLPYSSVLTIILQLNNFASLQKLDSSERLRAGSQMID